jgi:hypothetical protein
MENRRVDTGLHVVLFFTLAIRDLPFLGSLKDFTLTLNVYRSNHSLPALSPISSAPQCGVFFPGKFFVVYVTAGEMKCIWGSGKNDYIL